MKSSGRFNSKKGLTDIDSVSPFSVFNFSALVVFPHSNSIN
ncbi:hypothetical protein GAGA_4392 [Paraglaciecola agarilytica NO2]|uniref:Uncharacterized protein n=1 Tax=Paraglaciecola agarilytica NO2 TaxID=1125747 RepID=A0ABQ0IDA5_9ALTE|nr:hypothetical protein GAGA_4392 [Paraglaciecola agarilytica NO2]